MAGISGHNPVSDGFHKKFGFKAVATWPHFGYKLGHWVDVVFYSKELKSTFTPSGEPNNDLPPTPIPYLQWKQINGQESKKK